jgi:peptidoglycan lytic transglycosylase D
MIFKKIYIVALIVITTGVSLGQSIAQIQAPNFGNSSWVSFDDGELVKDNVLLAIESLKRAEAGISDSTTALKLEELGYLSITKSGFLNSPKDKYQRTGWWMLSYPIATKYGLEINSFIDERHDLVESTKAAYRYWSDLETQYGDSDMADMVFLESSISIAKFFKDSVSYPQEYLNIQEDKRRLTDVKRLYALHRLDTYIGPIQPVSAIQIQYPISFDAIHHYLQIPTAELKRLNPQWISDIYNPTYGDFLLPTNYIEAFEKHLLSMQKKTRDDKIVIAAANAKRKKQLLGDIPDLELFKPIRYKVKMGDNLGRIAQRYHVKISSIRSWNELNSDRIYAGQRLTIYVPIHQKGVVIKKSSKKLTKSKLKAGEYQEYIVQTGDTLWGISRQFENITSDIIMEDNGIDENISPGQVLKIRKVE